MNTSEEVNAFIAQSTSSVGSGTLCALCGKVLKHPGSVKRHFLDRHVNLGIMGYHCPACKRDYKSKNSMQCHISTYHRDWSGQFDYERFKIVPNPGHY